MPDNLKNGNFDDYHIYYSTIICKYQYISNEICKFNINNNNDYSISFNGKKYDEDLTRNYDISLSATCKDIIEYSSDIDLTSNNIEIITPNVSEYIELSGVNGKDGHILVDYHIPVNYFEIKFSYGNESIISGITINNEPKFFLYGSSFDDVNGIYTQVFKEYETSNDLYDYLKSNNLITISEEDWNNYNDSNEPPYIYSNDKCYIISFSTIEYIIPIGGDTDTNWYYASNGGVPSLDVYSEYDVNEPNLGPWGYNELFGEGNKESYDWTKNKFPHVINMGINI